MFPKAWVRMNCLSCHHWQKLIEADKTYANRTDVKEKPDHKKVLEGTATEKRFCTDCHGEHRLAFRTVWWDKKTGKLADRQGQRVKHAPDLTKKPARPEKVEKKPRQ
jgi:hypothetical protein